MLTLVCFVFFILDGCEGRSSSTVQVNKSEPNFNEVDSNGHLLLLRAS